MKNYNFLVILFVISFNFATSNGQSKTTNSQDSSQISNKSKSIDKYKAKHNKSHVNIGTKLGSYRNLNKSLLDSSNKNTHFEHFSLFSNNNVLMEIIKSNEKLKKEENGLLNPNYELIQYKKNTVLPYEVEKKISQYDNFITPEFKIAYKGIFIKDDVGQNGIVTKSYYVHLNLPLDDFMNKQALNADSISHLLDFHIKTANFLEISVHNLYLIIDFGDFDYSDEIFTYWRLINNDFSILSKATLYNVIPDNSKNESLSNKANSHNEKQTSLKIQDNKIIIDLGKKIGRANFSDGGTLGIKTFDNPPISDIYSLSLANTKIDYKKFIDLYNHFSLKFFNSIKTLTKKTLTYEHFDTNPFRIKVITIGIISDHWEYFWFTSQPQTEKEFNGNSITLFNNLEGKYSLNNTIYCPKIDDLEHGLDLKNEFHEEGLRFLKQYKKYLTERVEK